MGVYRSVDELVGRTPLLEVSRFAAASGAGARILAKLESFNPTASAKDRTALFMIEAAERDGLLREGSVIVEPTSGNTGVGLAAVGAARGYRVLLTMPDSMSAERRALLAAYGAELVLTDGARGMAGAIEKANELASELPGAFIPGQFSNPANAEAHYRTTGPELWEDCGGELAAFVAGVGTGGTFTGSARYLKERDPSIYALAVEPAGSAVLSGGKAGPHGLMGIGAGFVPEVLDVALIDETLPVTDEQAYAAARLLASTEGVLAGITSGAALHAAVELSRRERFAGRSIAVVLPDTGERYLSTPLFAR